MAVRAPIYRKKSNPLKGKVIDYKDVIRFLNVRVEKLADTPSIMMKKNTEEAE